MSFLYPKVLWLLILIPLILCYHYFKYGKENSVVRIPHLNPLLSGYKGWRIYFTSFPVICRSISLIFIIIALARPQSNYSFDQESIMGIDVMLTIDVSSSMLAMDLEPDRITEAKKVAIDFINSRHNDNIGIVEFAGEAYTICPLTTDHATLINRINDVGPNLLEDGTAIGDALAISLSRLSDSKSKSKIVILLTDGSNNSGRISPIDAAKLAVPLGIRVYSIAVGSDKGFAPVNTPLGIINVPVDVDEKTLKEIAKTTGGQFFRATDNTSLENIYKQIDEMEKTKLNSRHYSVKNEHFQLYLLFAVVMLLLDFILRNTILRKNP